MGARWLRAIGVFGAALLCAAVCGSALAVSSASAETQGEALVRAAAAEVGVPYCSDGGESSSPYGPSHGLGDAQAGVHDCEAASIVGFNSSGLTRYAVYQATGIVLPAYVIFQATEYAAHGGTPVSKSELQPGDLVFFGGTSMESAEHVGIYAGNGEMWDADTAWGPYGEGVDERSIAEAEKVSHYDGAIRYWHGNAFPVYANGQRFVEEGSFQQYIYWFGASLPLSLEDAEDYSGDGNTSVVTAPAEYAARHSDLLFPNNTVVRLIRTGELAVYSNVYNERHEYEIAALAVPAKVNASCLMLNSGQTQIPVVPMMWANFFSGGHEARCTLTNGTRFTEEGSSQQYISWYEGSLPVSTADAEAYDREGNTTVKQVATGYVPANPASAMDGNTVVRVVGESQLYLYAGRELQPIEDQAVAACLIHNWALPEIAVVPSMWADTVPKGFAATCSLPPGQRFVQEGSPQQYISWFGASLPLSSADVLEYDREGDTAVATMPPEYVSTHLATLPVDTVVRIVGGSSQYLYTGSELWPIGTPQDLACLLAEFNQEESAVVPTMWSASIPVGRPALCPIIRDNFLGGTTGPTESTTGQPKTRATTAKNTKPLTRLARALAKCHKLHNHRKRAKCEAAAKKRYGPKHKPKRKPKPKRTTRSRR